ncbi:MAG: hypothetical protein GEU74_06725 [Nitriliruptorales bacterium]|nr:hypothetical protein [Nitriliruptorales bacterium]
MTTIRATCPTCGEVGLTPDEIELRVDDADSTGSYYAFSCPSCFETVRKTADERIVRLLISGGVEALAGRPATPAPRLLSQRFDGPSITHDDLLDFHAMLERDDWFAALASSATED